MRPIATDVTHNVICVSVCLLVTLKYCAQTAEQIEMRFGEKADWCGPKEPYIR